MKPELSKDNEFPETTYEAKKSICPLGLDVQKIHACINDCILYRGEYENMDKCPVCNALRYKIRQDDPGDVEGDDEPPRKRVPAKVMVCSYNTTIETSVHKQRACQVVAIAQRRAQERREVETPRRWVAVEKNREIVLGLCR